MKKFTLSILVLTISLSVFAGNASRNFFESKIFSEGVPQHIVANNPQIQMQRSLIVKGEVGVEVSLLQVARNTQTGQFLFVWGQSTNETDHSIKGKLLNPQGNVLPGGELFLAAAQGFFSVTYNPKSNEFLLVYDNLFASDTVKSSIFVQRLNAAGKAVGNAQAFASDPNSANFSPKVTFNPKTEGYTILWDREDGMVGRLLTDKAVPAGPVVMIHKFINAFFPPLQLAYQPSGDKLLAVYSVAVTVGNNIESSDYYLATLDPLLKNVNKSNLKKINGDPVVRGNRVFWSASLAFLPDLTGMVFYADNNNIKRRQIDLKGKLKGSSSAAFNPPQKDVSMSQVFAAFSSNAKGTFGLLLGGGTWAQVLDSKGLPIGAPVQFISGGVISGGGADTTLYSLPNKPVDSFSRFVNYGFANARTDSGLVKAVWKVIVP